MERLAAFLGALSMLGLTAAAFLVWDSVPSPEYAWLSFKEKTGVINILSGRTSTRELTADLMRELRNSTNDARLTAVRLAKRPCSSGLINCRGLAESFVRDVAAAEYVRRTAEKESDLKERAQKSQEEAAKSAYRAAEATHIAAIAAKDSAETAQNTLFWTAWTAIVGAFSMMLVALGLHLNSRKT